MTDPCRSSCPAGDCANCVRFDDKRAHSREYRSSILVVLSVVLVLWALVLGAVLARCAS